MWMYYNVITRSPIIQLRSMQWPIEKCTYDLIMTKGSPNQSLWALNHSDTSDLLQLLHVPWRETKMYFNIHQVMQTHVFVVPYIYKLPKLTATGGDDFSVSSENRIHLGVGNEIDAVVDDLFRPRGWLEHALRSAVAPTVTGLFFTLLLLKYVMYMHLLWPLPIIIMAT